MLVCSPTFRRHPKTPVFPERVVRHREGLKSRAGLLTVLAAIALAPGLGCAERESTISQIDPYAGARPGRAQPLRPPPAVHKPAKPPKAVTGEAAWLPSRGISKRWRYIVVHHSANNRDTPDKMRDWHMRGRGWDELGYHFVIGNGVAYGDGQIYVGNRWKTQMHGAHCKTPDNQYNDHGIGICLIGDFQSSRPTQKQIASLARLLSFLSSRCSIAQGNIRTHGGITHKTACPGRNFSLTPVLRQMTQVRASAR